MSEHRFWISWRQPTEDWRPLNYPPNAQVLGCWCSGQSLRIPTGESGGYWTICALVEAENELAAKVVVCIDWPEAEAWRFCNPVDQAWRPGDRFLIEPGSWCAERIERTE